MLRSWGMEANMVDTEGRGGDMKRWEHNCQHCTYRGTSRVEGSDIDWYTCGRTPILLTVVGRYADEPHAYWAMPVTMLHKASKISSYASAALEVTTMASARDEVTPDKSCPRCGALPHTYDDTCPTCDVRARDACECGHPLSRHLIPKDISACRVGTCDCSRFVARLEDKA